MHPAKTQLSLGIRPVWSEYSLCAQWVAKDPSYLHALSEDWSDWANAQADLSLRWAHSSFFWFCHEVAQMVENFIVPAPDSCRFPFTCTSLNVLNLRRKYSHVSRKRSNMDRTRVDLELLVLASFLRKPRLQLFQTLLLCNMVICRQQ